MLMSPDIKEIAAAIAKAQGHIQNASKDAANPAFIGATEKMVEQVYGHHAPDYLRKSAKVLSF